ncbi:Fatty acyl-CoA reductase 1 [Monoraphidium neglectum]|uniref:Fatty acyl-CoA reductase n=1 Tax=Monoraphidium neglectum TaxID=145388 RepID=A0A0D2IX00_9CHLO|nr:Fatty acyl-CoA reductase 1 [Monoraphidium neglectum]KIY92507.1 Fatty acyl-CoA reductase 1 [Monoraphidium neglectum]|eukprot:XP_013891527.1 Fatty acyl-CoA reductase 1 [Monoraphidium neglectum]
MLAAAGGRMPPGAYSIRSQFRGATVLLTGATGYVGGLVLEALLRTTDVGRVLVLLRPKAGAAPDARLAQLLQASIFRKVRDDRHLIAKVSAVAGDISLPNLGLSDLDRDLVASKVQIILHCAADIRLEVDIQTALASNYLGTRAVLELARRCKGLRALVHTSSAFVNMNRPRSSVVGERLYPLTHGRRAVGPEEVVQVG